MKHIRKSLALLMALVMLLSALGTAAADGITEADTYVLNYNGVYDGAKWQYFSPYWPAFTLDGHADYTQSLAFTLYDTANEDFFPVYCTDLEVGLDPDSDFRRINLEDSTYAGSAAGMLRSVYLKGFPCTSLEALAQAAGVEGLTVGEAVAATQAAIWQIAHGDRVAFTDFADTIDIDWNPDQTYHFDACYAEIENGYAAAEHQELIREHIQKTFHYLLNLAPTEPGGTVASRSSFQAWNAEVLDHGDGTCQVVATATVDVALNEGDWLSLTASVGEYTASTALEAGQKEYTLTIENVPAVVADGTVKLTIEGVQSQSDVYLFDALGERGESQSLIGWTGNPLPVHAEVCANDRVVIFHKTDDGVGLQNITFDIYRVCSVEEYLSGQTKLGTGIVEVDGRPVFSSPTEEDIARYIQGLPFATVTTDADGQASVHFGTGNDGIYIVAERENSVTTGAIAPFFLAVPGGMDPTDTDCCEILIQPKNTVIEEDVRIEKDVNEIDLDLDTHHVGEVHTWIIQTSIPTGLATGLKYEITDTLNHQLTWVGNVRVTVAEKLAAAHEDLMELLPGEDYTLTVTEGVELVGDVQEPITSFRVALTRTGMEKVAAVEGQEPEVRVYFDAFIDEDAILGSEIPNQAHIHYENNVGLDFEKHSDQPEVYTCGISLVKTDASNGRKLAGASFTLNQRNEDGTYTPVEFYTDAALTRRASEVTTDADGLALFYGLKEGIYYLIETAAPEGYNLLSEPVEIQLDRTTHLAENALCVRNSAKFQLPETGGIGTAVFTLGGIGLLGAAALVLAGGKKKHS